MKYNNHRDQILNLARRGLSSGRISERLNLPRSTVGSVIYRARLSGVLPPVQRSAEQTATYLRNQNRGPRLGSLTHALRNQPPEFGRWLISQTPKDATLAETLTAIAVDVFREENPK